ncbi:MarR family transcriptional regulator [Erythrobacter sp. SG61-1L]|uniref:MarR family winged helix-turn-helix transcriptional regulator n=1 Tax=Erythrobacter sp. SG61-1L TaxID=1603897 RepID=UPI0006C91268|nr:MarR family transcriptional regulator [Erythrobacter sp. SG61-1L]
MVAKSAGSEAAQPEGDDSSFGAYRRGSATPEISFTISLVLAARRWRSLLDEKLRPINQSAARMEAMAAILNSPPLSPQVDIAKRLRIEGPTLTRMLDSLEKDGLVERLPDPNDRRTKLLRLTPEGEAVLKDVFAIADEWRFRLLDGFSPEETDQATAYCGELVKRLDRGLADPE